MSNGRKPVWQASSCESIRMIISIFTSFPGDRSVCKNMRSIYTEKNWGTIKDVQIQSWNSHIIIKKEVRAIPPQSLAKIEHFLCLMPFILWQILPFLLHCTRRTGFLLFFYNEWPPQITPCRHSNLFSLQVVVHSSKRLPKQSRSLSSFIPIGTFAI